MRWMVLSTAMAFAGCIVAPPGFDNDRVDRDDDDTGRGGGVIGTGSVELAWQVGPSGCEAAGVEEVEVRIGSAQRTFDCNVGRGSLQVNEGRDYELVAQGLDLKGFARYEGIVTGIDVFDGETTAVGTVRMQARTGEVELGWKFSNGEVCATNDVVEIDIALFQDNRIENQLVTSCVNGLDVVTDVVAGEYDISVLANDATGTARFGAESTVIVGEGEREIVKVELTPIP